jgi:hypothetical protein
MAATKKKSKESTPEAIPLSNLLPDEDADEYRALQRELLAELVPRGAFQQRIAQNLVDVEWDVLRHRRLMAALLRSEFRTQAAGVEEYGAPGRRSIALNERREFEHGRLLLAGNATAVAKMVHEGVTRSEIAAAAMLKRADAVAYHETRIADLERRRRLLLADLERLQTRPVRALTIDDAEEVD